MKATVGMSLGLVFVGLATVSVITILESSRPSRTPRQRSRSLVIHRICGYLFIGLFAVMTWSMSKRLIGAPSELSGATLLHVALAIVLAPLLFLKVMIVRRYKAHHAFLFPLGGVIYLICFLLVFIRVLPYAWARVDQHGLIVRFSVVPVAALCSYLTRLTWRTVRPPSELLSMSQPSPAIHVSAQTFQLELVELQTQTHDAKTLRFRLAEGQHLEAKPGQFLTFCLNIDGKEALRSYSICSSPLRRDHVEITPKRMVGGHGSVFLNDNAKVGLVLHARGPFGSFYFDEQLHAEIVLIAGGSGITPMMSMLRYIEDRAVSIPITLIYCVRTPQDVIFEKELIRLSRTLTDFRLCMSVAASDRGWTGHTGRLDKALLQEQIRTFKGPTFFLCGPKPFMQLASDLLKEQGVAVEDIKQESFGGNPSPAIPSQNLPTPLGKVQFSRSGSSCDLDPTKTLLELAELKGISIPYSCREGQCGTCVTRLLRGSVQMSAEDGLSLEQKNGGFILPCVSSARESVDLEA